MILTIFLSSCKKENNNPNKVSQGEKLVYITNEGAFQHDNGSISILEPDSSRITNYVFESANGRSTGDVVQSMGLANSKGYIVVNNNNLIKIVNLSTFKEIAELNIIYPRYFLEIDTTKAYITSGSMQGWVQIINLQTNKISDSIKVGNGPENLVKSGNYVYVANSGGWTTDSTVSVIDAISDKVMKTIYVGEDPIALVVDNNSDVWVICAGYYNAAYLRGESKIVKISQSSLTVENSFVEGKAFDNYESTLLAISSDKKTIYYQDSLGIFAYPINDTNLPVNPIISSNIQFSGLNVDPSNGDIYCLDAGNYSSGGTVNIYDKNGIFKKSYTAGIGTSGAYFNY
jgi:YVTN family beta-propeller protein